MTVLLGLVGLLMLTKIAWNMSLPYALMIRSRRAKEPITGGVSLALVVEWALLVVAVYISEDAQVEMWGPARVAVIGGGAIVASYLHFFALTFVLKRIRAKK